MLGAREKKSTSSAWRGRRGQCKIACCSNECFADTEKTTYAHSINYNITGLGLFFLIGDFFLLCFLINSQSCAEDQIKYHA